MLALYTVDAKRGEATSAVSLFHSLLGKPEAWTCLRSLHILKVTSSHVFEMYMSLYFNCAGLIL